MFSALILSAAMCAPADLGYLIIDPPPVVIRERAPVVVVTPPSVVVKRYAYVIDGPVVLRPVMPLRRAGRWLLGIPQPPSVIVR